MKRPRNPLWFALPVAVLLIAGATWLLWGPERHRQSSPRPGQISHDRSANGSGAQKANDDRANGAPEQKPDTDDDGETPGNTDPEEPNFPKASEDRTWNPADFANDRLAWRVPIARPDAARPICEEQYNGKPVFTRGLDLRKRGSAADFDPAQPDGMLKLYLSFHGPNRAEALTESSAYQPFIETVEATSHHGTHVYSFPVTQAGQVRFAIPYSFGRLDTVGLRVTGANMLPVEAVIGQAGCVYTHGGYSNPRHQILVLGEARPTFRLFPIGYTDYRQILVQETEGEAVPDAILTYDGVQILGRSDDAGALRYPWPGELLDVSKHDRREKFFFVSAPGYVPVLLERSTLENAAGPVEVTLKARELLVSVYETVPRPEVLKLGANVDRQSAILDAGLDLFPVPDDWPEFQEWTDVQRAIGYGFHPERYETHRANGKLQDYHPYDVIRYYQTKGTGPYEPGHEFGGDGAQKLADALGRRATEHWPEYARWYYGRWDYDEREGRFDVVLPFAGRFLLAVGEYNHGPKGDERNGGLTHVLYIDARNPARLQSKLLIHPQG